MTQVKHLSWVDAYDGSCSGTAGTPQFQNIIINGVNATDSQSGAYSKIAGHDAADPAQVFPRQREPPAPFLCAAVIRGGRAQATDADQRRRHGEGRGDVEGDLRAARRIVSKQDGDGRRADRLS